MQFAIRDRSKVHSRLFRRHGIRSRKLPVRNLEGFEILNNKTLHLRRPLFIFFSHLPRKRLSEEKRRTFQIKFMLFCFVQIESASPWNK